MPQFLRPVAALGLAVLLASPAYSDEAKRIPIEVNESGAAEWKLTTHATITAEISCRISDDNEYWPSIECRGDLAPTRDTIFNHIMSSGIEGEVLEVRKKNGDMVSHWNVSRIYSSNLYVALKRAENPIVLHKSSPYWLEDFEEYTQKTTENERESLSTDLMMVRLKIIATGVVSLFGVLLGLVILRRIWGSLRETFPKLVKNGIRAMDERRIHNLALSEAVKHSTRSSLKNGSDEEKEAIKQQIANAVENGDTELAKSLVSLLRKVEDR
ncbi:hypothetical protein [Halomonas sp. I5-271120]|uniref:hypothetical protein n=1 Tax=Halomonas sp. I5-271120 TaxID=3061632 RepID=UPI002714B90C|nr:hypothetical protein [Halomonas sp. I5-271120]